MLVIQGYFEAGQFIADSPVAIPENKKTVVTILDEDARGEDQKKQERIKLWREIRETVEHSDEALPDDFPIPLRLKTSEDLGLV
jgi:hypothetical protein